MIFVGLDLGQQQDPSAVAVVERDEHLKGWTPSEFRCMRVQYLERMPLGTPYSQVVARVREIVRRPEMAGCKLVVDATGVGRPVVELLRSAHLPCWVTAVTITGGDAAHGSDSEWHVPKKDLLTGLLVLLEEGQLKIPRDLKEARTLLKELSEIQVKHRAGGRVQMGAEGSGQHDDLVLAVALACWRARRPEIVHGTQRLV